MPKIKSNRKETFPLSCRHLINDYSNYAEYTDNRLYSGL